MEDAVEVPSDIDAVLKRLLEAPVETAEQSILAPEDEAYLTSLVAAVRSGRRAVLIVEDADERLRYMFSNATRSEAVTMLGKVVEATGRRISDGDD
jgi:sigma54-dependent transcription regulator